MVEVVSSLRRSVRCFHEEGEVVVDCEARKWPRTEESLKAGEDEKRREGATMTELTPTGRFWRVKRKLGETRNRIRAD